MADISTNLIPPELDRGIENLEEVVCKWEWLKIFTECMVELKLRTFPTMSEGKSLQGERGSEN